MIFLNEIMNSRTRIDIHLDLKNSMLHHKTRRVKKDSRMNHHQSHVKSWRGAQQSCSSAAAGAAEEQQLFDCQLGEIKLRIHPPIRLIRPPLLHLTTYDIFYNISETLTEPANAIERLPFVIAIIGHSIKK